MSVSADGSLLSYQVERNFSEIWKLQNSHLSSKQFPKDHQQSAESLDNQM